MQVSVTISGFTRVFDNDMGRVLDVARRLDALGVDQLMVADHVVMGDRRDRYPFGTFPYDAEEPWPEPLTLLTAMAAVTERVRLGTGILITPLRPPALLAKTVATLDQISGGRIDLGVGTGWQREEYAACGLDWKLRWQYLDDGLRACRALWRDVPASFDGPTVSFGPIWCLPQPVQPDGVPLWFGTAVTDEHVERIGEHAGGWLPIHTTTAEELRAGIDAIRAAYVRYGHDPATLQVRATARVVYDGDRNIDVVATQERNAWLVEAGVTSASIGLGRNLDEPAALERFITDALEAFHGI